MKQSFRDCFKNFKKTECFLFCYSKYFAQKKLYKKTKFHKFTSRKYRSGRRYLKKKIKREKYVDSDPEQTERDKKADDQDAEEDSEKDSIDLENTEISTPGLTEDQKTKIKLNLL